MAKERLQKILAQNGIASRRKAEELIAAGKVKVNGRPVSLGDKADPVKDVIAVCGKRLMVQPEETVYVMLNKPRGYVTTMSDEKGRKCVADLVESVGARVYPIGRLDKDSEGLLLFTNDGEFANAMMHPSTHVPKQYRVTLRGAITDEQLNKFAEGIELDGKMTLPAEITVLEESAERTVVTVVLREGRNRQIRRMFETFGLEVIRLKRTHIGGVKLGVLPLGQWRHLTGKEVVLLARSCTAKKLKAAEKYGRSTTNTKAVKRR